MPPSIRAAEPADIPGIQAVAEAAWAATHTPIVGADRVASFLDEYYTTAAFLEWIEDEDSVVTVATTPEDPVVGYVLGIPDDDGAVFHLAHIYVHPDDWSEGVGQALLTDFEATVRDRGRDRVRLGVMAGNDRAIDFYEAAGYTRVAEGYDDRLETDNYTYEKMVA